MKQARENKPTPPALVQITTRRQQRAAREARIADYHKLRDRVADLRGREYWRSLEELSDTPGFRRYIQNEFPEQAAEFNDPTGRRRFLKLMGASLALAGVGANAACSYQPAERLVPYVRQPEQIVPGKALFFATAIPHGAIGLLARSNWGHPTKAEGNPDHPASLGHTDIFGQASILQLYDPDRSKVVIERGGPSSWSRFLGEVRPRLEALRANGGAGLRILTETVYSPTLARQLRELLAELPQARWFQYEACGRDNARAGAVQAFGQPANTIYRFDLATRVFSIDSEFLAAQGGANLRYSHDYITAHARRRPARHQQCFGWRTGAALRRRMRTETDRRESRSPPGLAAQSGGTAGARGGCGGRRGGIEHFGCACGSKTVAMDRRARPRPVGASRTRHRHRRRRHAARRSRAGTRHERRARQHRHHGFLH